ncbi:unnamed protein product [Prunus armeniaca]
MNIGNRSNFSEKKLPITGLSRNKENATSAGRIEHWTSISAWMIAYDSGWIECNYTGSKHQHLQPMELSWKSIPNA